MIAALLACFGIGIYLRVSQGPTTWSFVLVAAPMVFAVVGIIAADVRSDNG